MAWFTVTTFGGGGGAGRANKSQQWCNSQRIEAGMPGKSKFGIPTVIVIARAAFFQTQGSKIGHHFLSHSWKYVGILVISFVSMKDSWFFIDFGSSSPIYYWLKERFGDSRCDLRGYPWTLGPSPPGEGLPPVFEVGMRRKKVGKVHVRMRLIDWLRLKPLGCIFFFCHPKCIGIPTRKKDFMGKVLINSLMEVI